MLKQHKLSRPGLTSLVQAAARVVRGRAEEPCLETTQGSSRRGERAVTGVLLVGGASTRFGSPKALARSAARRSPSAPGGRSGRRARSGSRSARASSSSRSMCSTTRSRCARRSQASIAGLRAATHETAVFLPVDCPLVTPELAAPARRGARGPTDRARCRGPTARTTSRVLERRLASGELSLRGVNPRVLEVDERLLANANTPAELSFSALEEDLAARDEHPARLCLDGEPPVALDSVGRAGGAVDLDAPAAQEVARADVVVQAVEPASRASARTSRRGGRGAPRAAPRGRARGRRSCAGTRPGSSSPRAAARASG